MQLENSTATVAAVHVADLQSGENRLCIICAKATFTFDLLGRVVQESDDPTPLFGSDEETELGMLPRDDLPGLQPLLDVILLGAAYAPGGRPVGQMTVSLAVGGERRQLLVSGDRIWHGRGPNARIGTPQPFLRMPLTYERAYGGGGIVLIDREAEVEFMDPRNPVGRGFDPSRDAESFKALMKLPEGYPEFEDCPRLLPNVEHPEQRLRSWADEPEPASWATLPLGSTSHGLRSIDVDEAGRDGREEVLPPLTGDVYQRASPGWTIPPPAAHATIALSGLLPGAAELELQLPKLEITADVCVGAQISELPLPIRMLVLEPERMRFYLVYRAAFPVPFREGEERSVRLRTE